MRSHPAAILLVMIPRFLAHIPPLLFPLKKSHPYQERETWTGRTTTASGMQMMGDKLWIRCLLYWMVFLGVMQPDNPDRRRCCLPVPDLPVPDQEVQFLILLTCLCARLSMPRAVEVRKSIVWHVFKHIIYLIYEILYNMLYSMLCHMI